MKSPVEYYKNIIQGSTGKVSAFVFVVAVKKSLKTHSAGSLWISVPVGAAELYPLPRGALHQIPGAVKAYLALEFLILIP